MVKPPILPATEAANQVRGDAPNAESPPLDRWWTIPNILCGVRILGSPGLIALALAERPMAFLILYFALAMTDWLDGKLAVLLNQRSRIGPILDTVSDVTLYSCLLVGIVWLKGDFLRAEAGWVAAGVGSYLLTVGIALFKFGKLPSYHTRAAKISWILVVIAVVAIFWDVSPWPLRVAAAMVVLTNLETAAISLLLHRPQTDVETVFHALKREKQEKST